MTTAELLAEHLKHDLGSFKWHLADFNDADFFVRPCPAANHAMWQLGHVLTSTGRLLAAIDESFKTPLPPSITSKFTKETAKIDDASQFPTPKEVIAAIDTLAAAARDWVASLPQEKLDAKSPEWAKDWAPTNGLLLAGYASHVQMHVGQIQVIRRCLGKKVLF